MVRTLGPPDKIFHQNTVLKSVFLSCFEIRKCQSGISESAATSTALPPLPKTELYPGCSRLCSSALQARELNFVSGFGVAESFEV